MMMKSIPLYILVLILLSCNGNGNEETFDEAPEMLYSEMAGNSRSVANAQAPPPEVQITKKVIKTGYLSYEVPDIREEYERISTILTGFKAFIESENQNSSDYRIDQNLNIRVPADQYDSLFEALVMPLNKIDSRSSNISDVTERYYDLQTRLRNKEALENRYLELLNQAKAMSDILEIERSLNEVRTEIERLQGQFNYLSKQISLSTINISFYQELPYNYEPGNQRGFFARLLQSLDDGWQGFVNFSLGFLRLWPFLILAGVVFWLIKKYRNRRNRNQD